MTHTEFYFATQNLFTIISLILFAIFCLMFFIPLIVGILGAKFNKWFHKNNEKDDDEK